MSLSGPGVFVGRVDELRHLAEGLGDVLAGTGRVVLLCGEGGIGKTRLCEELADEARRLDVGVGWAACWESGGGLPPFWPWRQLLDQLDVRLESTPAEDNAEFARATLFASVVDGLRRAAIPRRWLLVLDDIQWADAGSLRLLTHIAPLMRSIGVLLVATVRVIDGRSSPLPLDLLRHARSVQLDGLRIDELRELVEALTGSRPTVGVSDALHRATGGNALFAGELIRRLSREGLLDKLSTNEDFPVPPTVRAVLDERLADMSASCRELLEIAAVVGREFPLGLLTDLAGRDPLDLLADIEQASTGGIVSTVGVGRYAFAPRRLRTRSPRVVMPARVLPMSRNCDVKPESAQGSVS